jgi:hypothetical protein
MNKVRGHEDRACVAPLGQGRRAVLVAIWVSTVALTAALPEKKTNQPLSRLSLPPTRASQARIFITHITWCVIHDPMGVMWSVFSTVEVGRWSCPADPTPTPSLCPAFSPQPMR